jgi:hypothetical protein
MSGEAQLLPGTLDLLILKAASLGPLTKVRSPLHRLGAAVSARRLEAAFNGSQQPV